jgi:serine/threonine protein kinase
VGVTLGTGSFGRVRFATHHTTGQKCAIKMLKKSAVVRFQQASFSIFQDILWQPLLSIFFWTLMNQLVLNISD